MRYLLGPIRSIKVVEGKRYAKLPVEETAHVLVRGDSNVLGRINLSWTLRNPKSGYLDICGSKGQIELGWQEATYSLYSTGEKVIFGAGYDKVDAFTRQLNNFCETIKGNAFSLISEDDIIASVEVIEAGYRSLGSGEWENVSISETKTEVDSQSFISPEDIPALRA